MVSWTPVLLKNQPQKFKKREENSIPQPDNSNTSRIKFKKRHLKIKYYTTKSSWIELEKEK
jgi:hypothetical protein